MTNKIDKHWDEDEWESNTTFDATTDKWSTLNFHAIIKRSLKEGITEDTFNEVINAWTKQINSLETYDDDAYCAEIAGMNFGCPANEHDFTKLEIRYSELVSYLIRINYMVKIVREHRDKFESAYKSTKIIAFALGSGTIKDKEAFAEFCAQTFLMGLVTAKKTLNYLDDCRNQIDFTATNLNRILREREDERYKSSHPYAREGQSYKFQKFTEDDEVEEEPQVPLVRKKIN